MAILTILINVLVMENMSKNHFSKCKCPGGFDGDLHEFYQCSGQLSRQEFFSVESFLRKHHLWKINSKSISQNYYFP